MTRFQIDSVLQIMAMSTSAMGHYLHSPMEPQDSRSTEPQQTESRIAVENTLRAACDRLDKILSEDSRWNTEFQDKVERDYEVVHKLQLEVYARQRDAANEVISPHFRYRPTLFRMKDGSWCAFLGDLNQMNQGIIGVGESPQQSIEAFDDAFRGVSNPAVLEWMAAREKNLETGHEDQPFPTTNQNESNTMDSGRPSQTETTSQEGDIKPGNSEGAEPQF